MEIKPIFIIGTGHSGTTILYKMLARHSNLAWFSQYSCRGGEIPNRFLLPFYCRLNRILRFIFKHGWSKGGGGRLSVIPRPGDAEQIWDYIFSKDANVLRKIIEKECGGWLKNFFLAKNIRFHQYIPLLTAAYPQAKFIHIVRDGRAIILSRKYKIGERGEDRRQENIENFFQKAKEWLDVIKEINRQKEKIDILELRYEDFCRDVKGCLKNILSHSGLDEKKFPFDKLPSNLTSMNSRWFEASAKEEIAKIENIQKEMLQKYGYV